MLQPYRRASALRGPQGGFATEGAAALHDPCVDMIEHERLASLGAETTVMPQVFVSYSHDTDAHRDRVLALARRLRGDGVTVAIDADTGPGGPDVGWPQWSQLAAERAERVVVICSQRWAAIYDGRQPPGSGRGAAAEAQVIRQYLYDQAQSNGKVRVALMASADERHIPVALRPWHWFDLARDHGYAELLGWLRGGTGAGAAHTQAPPRAAAAPRFAMGFLMAVKMEVEVSRVGRLLGTGATPDIARSKAQRAAQQGLTACDWSRLRAADLDLLSVPTGPAPVHASIASPFRIPGAAPAKGDLLRRHALRALAPWLLSLPGRSVTCLPAQLLALPEPLRGPALALVVRQQSAGAGPAYELGVDGDGDFRFGGPGPEALPGAGEILMRMSAGQDTSFPSTITKAMLERERQREQSRSGPIPLAADHVVYRLAKALGIGLD